MTEKYGQIETLVENLRYVDAIIKKEEAGFDFDATCIWEAIFPEYRVKPVKSRNRLLSSSVLVSGFKLTGFTENPSELKSMRLIPPKAAAI